MLCSCVMHCVPLFSLLICDLRREDLFGTVVPGGKVGSKSCLYLHCGLLNFVNGGFPDLDFPRQELDCRTKHMSSFL